MKKDFKPQDGFDAEVVTIVDREFDSRDPFLSIMGDRKSGELIDFDEEIWILLNLEGKLKRESWLKKASGKRYAGKRKYYQFLADKFNSCLKNLSEKIPTELLEVIMEGRLKIAFLIDSDGGDMVLCERYCDVLKSLGGRSLSQVFITSHASSAAFELMTFAKESFMLNKSYLLWHFSDSCYSRREDKVKKLKSKKEIPEQVQREIEEMQNYFSRSGKFDQKYLDYLMELVTFEGNPQGDLIFCGDQMAELGLAKAYKSIESMQQRFNAEYMTRIDPEIVEFWELSKEVIEEMGDDSWGDHQVEEIREKLKNKPD